MILTFVTPFDDVSIVALFLAAGTYALAALWQTLRLGTSNNVNHVFATRCLLPLAWLFHAWALGTTLVDWASPALVAQLGFASFLSMMLWCVVGVYLFERLHANHQGVLQVLSILSILGLMLSWFFPGKAQTSIRYNWASLHWVFGVISYGLMGAALLHAAFWQMTEHRLRFTQGLHSLPTPGMPLLRLEALIFKFVVAAFVALSLTLFLGIWHAHTWLWNHKTVLSVLAWGVFACLLVGRQALGWRGRTAIGWLYAGSALLLLAYAGSRFVFEAILQRPEYLG